MIKISYFNLTIYSIESILSIIFIGYLDASLRKSVLSMIVNQSTQFVTAPWVSESCLEKSVETVGYVFVQPPAAGRSPLLYETARFFESLLE